MSRVNRLIFTLGLAVLVVAGSLAHAQGKKSDSVVKAEAKAEKTSADGSQVILITLTIDPDYHIYANPVGNDDFAESQTVVKAVSKVDSCKVEYPAGTVKEDKVVGNYKIYKDKVILKAIVVRPMGATDPLTFEVTVQACDKTRCLAPGKVKVSVP